MNADQKKVKLVIVLAIVLLVALFTLSIASLVWVNNAKSRLYNQRLETEQIICERQFYENQKSANADNKEIDQEIVEGN